MPTAKRGTAAMCLVDLRSGIGHCFCSMSCFHIWAKFNDYNFGLQQVRWLRQDECVHCYKCGDLARESPECDIHDGKCPSNLFDRTYAAHAIAKFVYAKLGRPLEEADIEAIREVVKDRDEEMSTIELAVRAVQRIDEVKWDRD